MMTMTLDDSNEPIAASILLDGYTALAKASETTIPFLAPPNAEWPQYILDTRAHGCDFGHLVLSAGSGICVKRVGNIEGNKWQGAPLLVCECQETVETGKMKEIINELESAWEQKWTTALVFCAQLQVASFRAEWEYPQVGCVKIDCQSCSAEWMYQPDLRSWKRLVILLVTDPVMTD